MTEPHILKNGKKFQKIVQSDYQLNSKGGALFIEKNISFNKMKNNKQKNGRMDIYISEEGDDYVTIIEIKGTNWDKIKEKNIKKNLYNHSKQLYRYIDKFLEVDKLNVCLGIIYPRPPKKKGLRYLIEKYAMDKYSFPVYWYTDIKT